MDAADILVAEPGSFRDREGRVYLSEGRVFRGLSQLALDNFHQLQATSFFDKFQTSGRLVKTQECPLDSVQLPADAQGQWAGLLEHDRIPVISYPYEWTFGMLQDAAMLQLDLVEAAILEGMSLKDATPYNIQFCNGQAVFIDVASFEPLQDGATWTGYRQFCEMFLFPLLMQAYKGVDFQPFMRASINGIDVQTAARLFGLRDRFRAGVLSHVWLQARLDQRYGSTQSDVRSSLKSAGFNRELILSNLRRLKKLVGKLSWDGKGSQWGGYTAFHNYTEVDHQLKEQFIDRCVQQSQPEVMWDIGCNTGQFSRIAARYASTVLAMDLDHLAVDSLYRDVKQSGVGNILPLLQNVADPSPNWGWNNRERTELAQRAKPKLVMCLALIHHVVISANVPLQEFVAWLAELSEELIIEFVSREDDKVQTLLRNKEDRYTDYSQENLQLQLQKYFIIAEQQTLESGKRHLYWCRQTSAQTVLAEAP